MVKIFMIILKSRTFIFIPARLNYFSRSGGLLAFIFLISLSCTGRRNKLDHSKMIPEKELPSLLAEIYMSDGLLSLPSIRSAYSSLDSLSGYVQVVEKHGYTKEEMDKTMKYYFIKKPKQLVKIYDRALGILSEKESYVEKEILLIQAHIENKWTGRESFHLFDHTSTDSVQIDMALETPGYYTLKFRALIYPDDQLVPAEISAFTCHRDSSESGKRDYIKSVRYIKDGQPHDYAIKIYVPDNKPLRLKGYFYNNSLNQEQWGKNAVIDKISLTYTLAAV